MKIDRIELFHVAIPLPKPFYPAWIPGYPQTENRFTLSRLTTDDGVEGIAAGVAFDREREGLGGLLGPYLIGLNPTDIATGRQRIREASFLGWRNYWLEAAFWDILGKVEGKPVWALLGGKEGGRVPVYASTGEVHRPEKRAEEVLRLKEMGFRTVKLRVHSFDPAEDVAQVRVVREAVGEAMGEAMEEGEPGPVAASRAASKAGNDSAAVTEMEEDSAEMALAVDANQGWRVALVENAPLWTLERATDFARACADLQVAWLEEPLDMYAYDELAELRRRSTVPIAGGEMNGGWHEFKIMLEKGSLDVYQPDATMGGGISGAKRVLDACRSRGLLFSPHTWTNGLGFLINLHVYAAGPRDHPLEYPFEPPGWVPEARDGILKEPILVDADGTVPVPETPGLGIEIDEERLARFGEKFFEITSRGIALNTVREKGLFAALRLARKRRKRTLPGAGEE